MKRNSDLGGGTASKRMRFLPSHSSQGQYGMSGMGDISGRPYNYYQGMNEPGSSMYQMNWQPPLPPGPPTPLFNPAQPPPPLMPPAPAPPPPPESPSGRSPKLRKPKLSDEEPKPKSRKKSMSSRYARREWNREDAAKVLAVESEEAPADPARMLLIKFPDPKVTRDIVQGYSSAIEAVHFQQPVTPRYCFVKLHPGADVEATIAELSRIPFGGGTISAEVKHEEERVACLPEEVDPYSLYVGNLPQKVTVGAVKEIFPTADQVDVGFSQRMKYTRYAFIRYSSVEGAIEAFRRTRNLVFESRSLIVRFYRHRASTGMPGEPRMPLAKKTPAVQENKPSATVPEAQPEVENATSAPSESVETQSEDTCDSKANVLAEAARVMQDMTPPKTPSVEPQVTVKTEAGVRSEVGEQIKTELLDQDLDDILYDKLISAQRDTEQPEGEDCDEEDDEEEFEELSEEEANDEDALRYGKNHWDILRKEEESRKEIKHTPVSISDAAALSSLPLVDGQLDRLVSLFSSDFGDYGEPNDPEVDDLFNELNPNDLEEEEFSVFSS